jgi:hypothetical protein
VAANDFYFAVNATFRHLHDTYGKAALIHYWQRMAEQYYADRTAGWRAGGLKAVADDWRQYFAKEPLAEVDVQRDDEQVRLDIRVCPAIKHLRDNGREIVPYFCEHCDHICGTMAHAAGMGFEREGGMGSCTQRFVTLTREGAAD